MNHSKRWLIRLALVAMVFIGFSCGALDGGGPEVYLIRDSEDTFHFQWNEPLVADRIILVRAVYSARTDYDFGTVYLSSEEPAKDIYLPDAVNTIEKIEYEDFRWKFTVGYVGDEWSVLREKLFSVFDSLEFTHKRYEEAGAIRHQIEIVNQPMPSDFSDFAVDSLEYTVDVDYTVTYPLNDSSEDQLLLFKTGSLQSRRISLSRIFDPPSGSGICTVTIPPADERKNVKLPADAYDLETRDYEEILTGYPLQPYNVGDPSYLTFDY